MARFDKKTWNDNVFQKYLRKEPNMKVNSLLKSGVLENNASLKARLVDGVGGNTLTEPIKGMLDGEVLNYDGTTNLEATSRDTFQQRKIVVGRMKAWQEKDFSTELTGEKFIKNVAGEVAEYYEGVDQDDLLAILKGIFSMSDAEGKKFVTAHTNDITAKTENEVGASTLNSTIAKASGDKKQHFTVVFMHSVVATNLENLQLLNYMTYTDKDGIQKQLTIATWNGRTVFIDDEMPTEEVAESTSGKGDGYTKYTSYVLGTGAFEYCDIGAKVPSEIDRDPKTNGGIDVLYTRQRKLFAPKWISWEGNANIISPKPEQLATGSNWKIVNNGESGANFKTVNHKAIPFARIISRG